MISEYCKDCIMREHCVDCGVITDKRVQELEEVLKNSISKDKIQEYKEKFIEDSKNQGGFITQSSQINASLISFCNELLKE